MFPSEAFYSQLRRHEGFYPSPYSCTKGAATIGYGTNLDAYPAYIPFADLRAKAEKGALNGKALAETLKARGMRWSREQAEDAMRAEVQLCISQLERLCPAFAGLAAEAAPIGRNPGGISPAAQARAECLINMCFNMGIGGKGRGLLSFVNALALIEAGRYAEAAENMLKSQWRKEVKGRAVELAEQMRTGVYQK